MRLLKLSFSTLCCSSIVFRTSNCLFFEEERLTLINGRKNHRWWSLGYLKKIQEKCIQKDNADADPFVIIFSQNTVCQNSNFCSKIQADENAFKMVNSDFISKIDNFWRKNILNIWIFKPNSIFSVRFWVQISIFWPKFSNISLDFKTKIHIFFWILAQKFKLNYLWSFD